MVNIAFYRREDWDRFVNSIDDRESMHKTWEEWFLSFLKAKDGLAAEGIVVNEVIIDIDELSAYCRKNRLKNNGKTRSQFAAKK